MWANTNTCEPTPTTSTQYKHNSHIHQSVWSMQLFTGVREKHALVARRMTQCLRKWVTLTGVIRSIRFKMGHEMGHTHRSDLINTIHHKHGGLVPYPLRDLRVVCGDRDARISHLEQKGHKKANVLYERSEGCKVQTCQMLV